MTYGEQIGKVVHFYNNINVAVLRLSRDIKIGDVVHFLGRSTDVQQEVTSMEVEHEPVTEVKAGGEVAIKVKQRVRRGDSVFRIKFDT